MKHTLSTLFKRFRSPVQPPLGRWRVDYCSKKLDHKVNLTNEDHCGTCSSYRLTRVTATTAAPAAAASANVLMDDMRDTDDNLIYLCL